MGMGSLYVDGEQVETVEGTEDASVSLDFYEDSRTCKWCGAGLEQYPLGWEDEYGERGCDSDDGPGTHEVAEADDPGQWANGAGIVTKSDEVSVWISVGDPRGGFRMTVTRWTDEGGNERLRLHVPYEGMGQPHMDIRQVSPGTFDIL